VRVILVGSAGERARLRSRIAGAGLVVVGEAPTLAAAGVSTIEADALLVARAAGEADAGIPQPLTPREVEILALVAEGLSNKAIASRLGISDQTVKFHVSAIYGKLGASNRTDAVGRGVRRGLIVL